MFLIQPRGLFRQRRRFYYIREDQFSTTDAEIA